MLKSYFKKRIVKYIKNKSKNDFVSEYINGSLEVHKSVEKYCTGGWSITKNLGKLVIKIIKEEDIKRVIEFGAGSSSLVISSALAENGEGKLVSLEQRPEWCKKEWKKVENMKEVKSSIIHVDEYVSWGVSGLYYSFGNVREKMDRRKAFDLVFIDAPQYFFGREGTLPIILPHIASGGLVVLDDAGRSKEQFALYQWLRSYPGLELVCFDEEFGGKGVAILENSWTGEKRFSPLSFLASIGVTFSRWRALRDRSDIEQ